MGLTARAVWATGARAVFALLTFVLPGPLSWPRNQAVAGTVLFQSRLSLYW
jgi:hypothetical protein